MQDVYIFNHFIQESMQRGQNCLGCKTSFEQGTCLPLQDLVIELKNYSFPIRDQKHKWILLKTIVSLLNSKGGIIFIGAQDKTGQVLGLQISRKQQDEFKLFIQKLVQRIQPSVDLSNRQDIMMQFVPVTKDGINTGRFLGKIIVKQGDTSKLYCFSQKVVLQGVTDRKYDQFDVVYSYKRINMGSVKELQGYDVVVEAANRAVNPPKTINIFHQGCNPQPLSLSYSQIPTSPNPKQQDSNPNPKQPLPPHSPTRSPSPPTSTPPPQQQLPTYSIQFFKIKDSQARQKLQNKLQEYIQKIKAKQYNISYEQQTDTLVLQFIYKTNWNNMLDLIDGNLEDLNQALDGDAVFSKKQAEQDYAVYENQKPSLRKCVSGEVCQMQEDVEDRPKSSSKNYIQKSPQKQQKKVQKQGRSVKKLEVPQKNQQKSQTPQPPQLQNKSESLQQQVKQKGEQYKISITTQKKEKSMYTKSKFVSLPQDINIDEILILTITHLNIQKKAELIKYLLSIINKKIKTNEYERSIEFVFEEKQLFLDTYDKLEKSKDIVKFGFNKVIIFGVNTGQITFDNYDRKQYREFKDYIAKSVGVDMKRCQFTKKGTKYSLVLTLKSAESAARWLDKFINDQNIKQYRIPNNENLKMKIDLVCIKPNSSKHQNKEDQ